MDKEEADNPSEASKFHEWQQKYGRLSLATCALIIRITCLVQFFSSPLNEHGLIWRHYCLLFIVGFTLFVSPTVEKPIVSDLAEGNESMVVPMYLAIGGMPSYFVIMSLLGLMAERIYGYVKPTGDVSQLGHMVMSVNANALRMSLMWILSIATVVNIGLYVVVHFSDTGAGSPSPGTSSCESTSGPTNGTSNSGTYPLYAIVLYHVFTFLDAYATQSLYVCMGAFEVDLGLSPSALSIIATAHILFELALSPLWGYLVDNKECHYVQSIAMLIIGITSILLACTSSYPFTVFLRLLHGGALGCTGPVIQKIITGSRSECEQATWFGIYAAVFYMGCLLSCGTNSLLSMKNLLGHYGWRLCYSIMGYAWLLLAPFVFKFMKKPNGSSSSQSGNGKLLDKLKCMLTKKSFWLIVVVMNTAQAVFAFSTYMALYFQYSGLSDKAVGWISAARVLGAMFGCPLGGKLIDWLHNKCPQYGRLGFAVVALGVRLAHVTLLMWWPVPQGGPTWKHYVAVFVIGATLVTVYSIDRPILDDIAPKESKALTLSVARMIAGVPSSLLFPPLIGNLAERVYGYVKGAGFRKGADPVLMALNANALRRSIMYIMICATLINIVFYVGLFFTYKGDKGKTGEKDTCPATAAPAQTTSTSSCSDTSSENDNTTVTYTWYAKVLCFVPAFVQGVNLQLLPICMRAFEITLGLSPSRLSWIPSVQIIFFLGISPLWGVLLDNFKKKLITYSALPYVFAEYPVYCWVTSPIIHWYVTLCSSNRFQVMLFTVLNACGNAACIAVAPKMITGDSQMSKNTTLWFGVNWSLYCIGALITSNITVSLSMKSIGGVYGWRVCHCLVGYLWLVIAAPIFFWMKKPDGDQGAGGGVDFQQIKCIMQKTTFWLMVCVGYTSQAAFAVLVYLTMYLQSSGVPGMSIGFAFSVVMIGNLAGGFSGGFMTDKVHDLNKCYGKLSVGAVTVLIRVVVMVSFLWNPIPGGTFRWYHHIYLFVYGITFFTIKAVDISISADLAPGSAKSLTIGLVGAIGGVASNATVVPAVGYLCENRFGYITSTEGGGPLPPEVMANNVSALRNSMLIVFVVCSIINIALYLVALATYGKDKDNDKDNKACPTTPAKTTSTSSCNKTSEDSKTTVSYTWYGKVLYHVYPVVDAIDMEILPICMRAFEVSFGCSPATLSLVAAAEQGALLLMSPLWGYLLGIKKPYQVESAAMLVCGMMCILLGTTTNYRMLVLATLVHGATLGCTGPTHQKIITSSVQKDQRDMWYGMYTGVYYLGAMVSCILACRLSLRNVLGQYGWRLYYCVVGYMWLAAAVPTYYGMRPEPKNGESSGGDSSGQSGSDNKDGSFWKGISALFKKPSYYFMISLIFVSESCELFSGYIVIYLQYCGVRNQMAGFAVSVVHMGNMVAGFIGGYAIQKIHCASKDYGKQLTGIGLIAIRLFAITVLFWKPFEGGHMRWYHYMCLALFGFAQLNRTSIDRTMLSDFVDEKDSAIALSLCRVIAGIPSNFTFPPLIGYLAERAFGYITTDALVEDMDAFTKVTNATALSKSLLYIVGFSCLANMALYGGMMFTYKTDVKAKEAKECKKEKATEGTEGGGVAGGGDGSPSGSGSGAQSQGAASTSTKAEATNTSPPVTVSTTSVICEGSSISSSKTTHAKSTEVSYVGCASYSEKANTTCVAAVASSTSGENGSTTAVIIICDQTTGNSDSATNEVTSCSGLFVTQSNDANGGKTTTLATCDSSSVTTKSGTTGYTFCSGIASRESRSGENGKSTTSVAACNRATTSVGSTTSGLGAAVGIGSCSGVSMSTTQKGDSTSYEVITSTSLGIGIGVGVATPTSEDKGTSGCSLSKGNAVTVKAYKGIRISFGISIRSRLKFSIKGSPKSSK